MFTTNTKKQFGPADEESSEIGESQDKLFLRDFGLDVESPILATPPPPPAQVCTKRLAQTTCPLGKCCQQNKMGTGTNGMLR